LLPHNMLLLWLRYNYCVIASGFMRRIFLVSN
jgi:hypothetical protein